MFCFIRWWYMVPTSMSISKTCHHLHSSFEKSIIERAMQYIKDRIESFDDYFPCKKNKCKLNHIKQWLKLFVYQHNKEIIYLEPIPKFDRIISLPLLINCGLHSEEGEDKGEK